MTSGWQGRSPLSVSPDTLYRSQIRPAFDATTAQDHMAPSGTSGEQANTGALEILRRPSSMNINYYRLAKVAKGVIASPSTGTEQEPVWIGVLARLRKEVGRVVETVILKYLHSD